jgi:hypothetical protein
MNWLDGKTLRSFGLRFVLLFVVVLAPLPWLADAYTTAFGTVANAFLFVADHGSRIGFRFEPPDSIRASGSWTGVVRVDDRQARQSARMKLDVRSFSYRPIATFLALGIAARLWRGKRNAILLGAGLLVVMALTSAITVISFLRFGVGRVLGFGSGPVSETIYEASTTPAMTFVLPLLCFCGVLWMRRVDDARKNAGQQDAAATL